MKNFIVKMETVQPVMSAKLVAPTLPTHKAPILAGVMRPTRDAQMLDSKLLIS